jgi:hypothetical protein
MLRYATVLTLLLLWPLALQAQVMPPVETPIEQAVARVAGDKLTAVRVMMEHVLETREEAFPVTKKISKTVVNPTTMVPQTVFMDVTEMQTRTVTVTRPVYKQVMLTFDLATIHATEFSGAKLDAAALKTRLAKQSLILLTTNGVAVPEKFAMLFRPETIVVDLQSSAAAPPPPPPTLLAPAELAPAPAVAPVDVELPRVGDIPPQFRLASIDAQGNFKLRAVATQTVQSTRFVTKTEERMVEGKVVTVVVCEPITVTEHRESTNTVTYPPATGITGVTVDGKPLGELHRAALREREIPVAVSPNGKPLDSFWLQNIRPMMLALTIPAADMPAPAAPFGAPVPMAVPLPVLPSAAP